MTQRSTPAQTMSPAPKPKVLVVLCQGGPRNPAVATTGLIYAQTAKALDAQVEVHLTGESVQLAFEGVAGQLYSDAAQQHSLLSHMQRCAEMGIPIYVCGMAIREHHRGQALIPLLAGQAGTTTVMGQMLHDQARVLTF